MAITTRQQIIQNLAKGLGWAWPVIAQGPGSNTSTVNTANSGQFVAQLLFNTVNTSEPGTIQGFPQPAGLPGTLLLQAWETWASRGGYLCWFYKIGTVDLSATGDKFTHDAATFPVLRTQMGQASQPVNLIPVLFITTAQSASQASFILKVTAGGNGYVGAKNLATGNSVAGTKSFVLANNSVLVNTAFVLKLEDGDCGIQDILQVSVGGSPGGAAATIYGAELIAPISSGNTAPPLVHDAIVGSFSPGNIEPAVATSGTATAALGFLSMGVITTGLSNGILMGVVNS